MMRALRNFRVQGVIAWIDVLMVALCLWTVFIGIKDHHPFLALTLLGPGVIIGFCAYISFSAAGQVPRLKYLPGLLVASAFINIALGFFIAFGTNRGEWIYLFLLVAIGNLFAAQSSVVKQSKPAQDSLKS